MKHFFPSPPSLPAASPRLLLLLGLASGAALAPHQVLAQAANASALAATPVAAPVVAPVLISELRSGGPRGVEDAFIELFNTTEQPISLSDWSLQFRALKGAPANVKLAPGTRIGARGHLLLTGSQYSLQSVAKGDARFGARLDGGVRLLNPQGEVIDAVGPQSADSGFREGGGLPAFVLAPNFPRAAKVGAKTPPIPQFSAVRKAIDGQPQDSGDNARDFVIVSVTGAIGEQKTRIGVPGPENAASPRLRPLKAATQLIPAPQQEPNGALQTIVPQTIALQTDPERNSMRRARRDTGPLKTFGTMTLRYRLVNDTPNNIKNLSFRVNGITAYPDPASAPAKSADVRLIRGKAPAATVQKSLPNAAQTAEKAETEAPRRTMVQVWKAKLAPAPSQPLGGGLNALLNVDLPPEGIAPGASGEVWFSFGVERRGDYRVVLGNQMMNLVFEGNTEDDLSQAGGEQLEEGWVRRRPRITMPATTLNAAGNGQGPLNQTGAVAPVDLPANQEEAEGIFDQGNTEEGVPSVPKPSSKAS